MDPRTRVLLEAPIAPTLLRLALPNMLVMLAQAAAGLVETYFIGKLGTDALAGVALVFPVVMLMQMMSAGDRFQPSASQAVPWRSCRTTPSAALCLARTSGADAARCIRRCALCDSAGRSFATFSASVRSPRLSL